jgi:hypothetical protein
MNNGLRKAIYNLGLTVSGLSASNLFYKQAPKGTNINYCVFSEISNPSAGRSTLRKREDSYIQFSVYGDDQTALESLAKSIRSKFDNSQASFSISDYYVLEVQWQLTRDSFSADLNQIIVQYKFLLQVK